jgi:hypothetical protein
MPLLCCQCHPVRKHANPKPAQLWRAGLLEQPRIFEGTHVRCTATPDTLLAGRTEGTAAVSHNSARSYSAQHMWQSERRTCHHDSCPLKITLQPLQQQHPAFLLPACNRNNTTTNSNFGRNCNMQAINLRANELHLTNKRLPHTNPAPLQDAPPLPACSSLHTALCPSFQ